MTHQYSRAERLLTRPFPLSPPSGSPFASRSQGQPYAPNSFPQTSLPFTNGSHSQAPQKSFRKGKNKEPPALPPFLLSQPQLGANALHTAMQYPDFPNAKYNGVSSDYGGFSDNQNDMSRLVDMSIACRYLAAQCQVSNPLPFNVRDIIRRVYRFGKENG